MAIDDIDFSEGDRTVILELTGSPSLNAPDDMLVSAGAPNGLIDEIPAGSLNAPTDICNTKMQIIEIKRTDCFAA